MTNKEALVHFVAHSKDGETARRKYDTWKKLCRAVDEEDNAISTGVQQEYKGPADVAEAAKVRIDGEILLVDEVLDNTCEGC